MRALGGGEVTPGKVVGNPTDVAFRVRPSQLHANYGEGARPCPGLQRDSGTGTRKPPGEDNEEEAKTESPLAGTEPGLDPRASHEPPDPVTRQIMAREAGLHPHAAASAGGSWEVAACARRASVPSPPEFGRSGRLTIFSPLWEQPLNLVTVSRPAAHFRFREPLPPHPPEVRPSGRGRKEGAGRRQGAARGRGSHGRSPEGPRAKGAVRVWAGEGRALDETCYRGGKMGPRCLHKCLPLVRRFKTCRVLL